MISKCKSILRLCLLALVCVSLSGCDDPQVYGSVGISSGWGGYHSGPRIHTSISVGGRIR